MMAETLGSLIDKLTIANIRLWHLEDLRRDLSLPNAKRLAAADKIAIVNSERNDLMDEIDQYLFQPMRVADEVLGDIGRDFDQQLEPL